MVLAMPGNFAGLTVLVYQTRNAEREMIRPEDTVGHVAVAEESQLFQR